MAARKRPTEREMYLLLAFESTVTSLLTKRIGGMTGRYAFLKEPLIRVRKERVILEAAMNGDTEAKRMRASHGG